MIQFVNRQDESNLSARQLFRQLKEKSQFVKWHNEERKEKFALFAKSFKEKFSEWQGHEVFCFDLQDIETRMKNAKRGVHVRYNGKSTRRQQI